MPDLDLGPAIEAVLGVLPIDPDDSTTPTACDGRGICAWSPARKHAQRIVEAALPELRKAIAEEQKPDHVAVVHALTHAVDKLATAKAALREILHAHGGCMAAVMAEQWRAVLADLDAEPHCVRGQSGGRS